MKSAWAEGKPSKKKTNQVRSHFQPFLGPYFFTFHISFVVYSSLRTFQMGDTKKNKSQFNILVLRREMGHTCKNGSHLEKWATLKKNGSQLEKCVTFGKMSPT